MNTKRHLLSFLTFLILGSFTLVNAQELSQYDIRTSIVRASDTAYEAKLVGRDTRQALELTGFEYKNYYLNSTDLHSATGGRDVSFGASFLGIAETRLLGYPIKVNWKLGALSEANEKTVLLKGARFSSNFPVSVPVQGDQNRKVIEYRGVNFTIQSILLKLDQPKVIATAPHPGGDDKIFFVVSVSKSAT